MGHRSTQLSVDERRRIERWRHAKVSPAEMARVFGRNRSTIFRELTRTHFADRPMPKVVGYFAMAAQFRTADRRTRQRKLVRHAGLRAASPSGSRLVGRLSRLLDVCGSMVRRPGSARSRFVGTSIRRMAGARSCGGICPTTG